MFLFVNSVRKVFKSKFPNEIKDVLDRGFLMNAQFVLRLTVKEKKKVVFREVTVIHCHSQKKENIKIVLFWERLPH